MKARTVKLFRLVACTLYSHFEDQATDRTSCQKHRGNNGMMKYTGLNYLIQGQMLGFYVLGGEALVCTKEGSLLKLKSFGRMVMSCRWVSRSHYSPGITVLMSGSSHTTVQHHIPEDSCIFSNITVRVSDLNKFGEHLINCEVLRKDPVPYISCCLKMTFLIHIIATLVTLCCHINTFHLLVYFMCSLF